MLSALDLLEGEARLASDLDASAPEVAAPADGFALRDLRHPILVLQGKKVIPSDVRLEPPRRALVVSGPNGGGKTVAITAVGLSALLLRAGLPVAAARGSRLPFYPSIRAAVEEHGDLARDLSTFTAHLTAVRDIGAGAGPGTLVLVDEIAADTDPREGAALASAILEDLIDRGATVLVTTHLDELKALALSDPRFANARVGFDAERLAPTFQLHLGSPGSSSAIEVARRVGLPEPLLERARAALSGRGGALGEALRLLSEERSLLEAQRAALARESAAARAREEAARRKEEAAFRAEKEAAARVAASLAEEVEAARDEVRRVLASLQSAPTVRKASEAARQLEEWSGSLEQASRVAASQAAAAPEAAPDVPIGPGVRVAWRLARPGGRGARDTTARRRSCSSGRCGCGDPSRTCSRCGGARRGPPSPGPGRTGSGQPRRRARHPSRRVGGASTSGGCGSTSSSARSTSSSTGSSPRTRPTRSSCTATGRAPSRRLSGITWRPRRTWPRSGRASVTKAATR